MLMRSERARMSGAASAVLGGTFLIGALARATDGFTESVGRAAPSVVLGVIAGVALLVAAFGLLSLRYWGFRAGLVAHLLAIGVVLFALFSVAAGYGGGAASLAIPGVFLVLLSLSLIALWRARPRNPAQRLKHEIAAKMY